MDIARVNRSSVRPSGDDTRLTAPLSGTTKRRAVHERNIRKFGPRGLINDIFSITRGVRFGPPPSNVIACRKHGMRAAACSAAVTCREIKSARFAMNKLSSAGIHSRRDLRVGDAFLAAYAGRADRALADSRAARRIIKPGDPRREKGMVDERIFRVALYLVKILSFGMYERNLRSPTEYARGAVAAATGVMYFSQGRQGNGGLRPLKHKFTA